MNKHLTPPKNKIVALIEWSHLIEDYLGNIGISMEDFTEQMTGGWLFGYIEALKLQEVTTVLICFSSEVKTTKRIIHKPTGALICVLPSPRMYRYIRNRILNPYASTIEEAAGIVKGLKRNWYVFLLKIAAYTSTPFLELYKEIKRQQCDIILCQDYEHARFDVCALLGKIMRIPIFATFQGGNWQLSTIERFVRHTTLKWSKGLVVASAMEIMRLEKIYKLRPIMIGRIFNPVDLSMWAGPDKKTAREQLQIEPGIRIVVWHGRIDYHRKGLDILLDAWEQITLEYPDHTYRLILVGSGNNADLLAQRLIKKPKGVTWISRYINDRKEMYHYLKAADIYVFPSRNEGFPVAPLEAMACGLPLIASEAPGVADILKNGEESGGVLLPINNSLALATALNKLIKDPPLCDQLGKLALQNVQKNFSLSAVGIQLSKFLFKK